MKFRVDPAEFSKKWALQQPFWVSHTLTMDSASMVQAYAALSTDSENHFICHVSPQQTVLGFAPDHVLAKTADNYVHQSQYLANGQLRLRQEINDYKAPDFTFPPAPYNTLAVGAWFGAQIPQNAALSQFLPQGFYMRPRLLLVFDASSQTLQLQALIDQQVVPDQINSMVLAEALIENALHKLLHHTHMLPLHSVVTVPSTKALWADVNADNTAYVHMPYAASALCLYRQLCRFYETHHLQLFCVDTHAVVLHHDVPLAVLQDDKLLLPHGNNTEQLLQAVYAAEYG